MLTLKWKYLSINLQFYHGLIFHPFNILLFLFLANEVISTINLANLIV